MSFENEIRRAFNGTLFEYTKYISNVTGPAIRANEKILEENSVETNKVLDEGEFQK